MRRRLKEPCFSTWTLWRKTCSADCNSQMAAPRAVQLIAIRCWQISNRKKTAWAKEFVRYVKTFLWSITDETSRYGHCFHSTLAGSASSSRRIQADGAVETTTRARLRAGSRVAQLRTVVGKGFGVL